MPTATITTRQRAAFWRLFSKAARARGIPSAQRDEFRHKVLAETLGVSHLADVDRTHGYDRLMERLAFLAEDTRAADRFSVADARRTAALVADECCQVAQLSRATDADPLAYVAGILKQARLSPPFRIGSDYYLDLHPSSLRALLQILDTHRRRLLSRLAPDIPKAYVYGRRLAFNSTGYTIIDQEPPPPAFFKVRLL